MRLIGYFFSAVLLLSLAGCITTGDSAGQGMSGQSPQDQQQALLFKPEPGLAPKERYLKSISLLEVGEAGQAKAELLAYLAEDPGGRYTNPTKGLLEQIDTDPKVLLGTEYFIYKMKSGESLSSVAKQYLGGALKFYALARYNELDNPSQIKVGQVIKVPGKEPLDMPSIPEQELPPETEPGLQEAIVPAAPGDDESQTPGDADEKAIPTPTENGGGDAETDSEDFKIQELNVDRVQTIMDNAQERASAGDFEGAANVLEEGILQFQDDEMMPKIAAANYITLAGQLTTQEQYDRAGGALKRAAELDPQNPEIRTTQVANYMARADQARNEGRNDEELELLMTALQIDPQNAGIRDRLRDKFLIDADQSRSDGRLDEERKSLELALKLDPENSEIRERLATSERLGKAEVFYKRGQEYQNANQPIEAFATYGKAIAISPDYGPALDALNKIKPEVVDIYYKQGMESFSRQELVEAIDRFDKALEVNPDHEPSKIQRIRSLQIQDRLKKIPTND
ncbi:MAG: LysM peptidoglycan-binding domain-containing protein [Rhodospirillales bacterium]|nr:LysM peptidoglycan-binding domain-containing protein [Rhodospirillales bacterium]MDH3913907.1 LysM peptidoglycan-binding domain-containing protein [Rhodospirillales bacterium]